MGAIIVLGGLFGGLFTKNTSSQANPNKGSVLFVGTKLRGVCPWSIDETSYFAMTMLYLVRPHSELSRRYVQFDLSVTSEESTVGDRMKNDRVNQSDMFVLVASEDSTAI